MKRRPPKVLLIVLLLVGGAIVNVAVAWALNSPGFPLRSIRGLPYRPIWPGFAINTLFYAAILWLLFAAPFVLRRRFRGGAQQARPVPGVRLRPAGGPQSTERVIGVPRVRRGRQTDGGGTVKRRLFMVLLLLVAGAIVNVAVAWAIVAYSTDRFSSDLSARESIATMQTTSGGYLYRERAADGSIRTRPEFPGLDHATEEYTATGIHYRITSSRGASTLVDVRAGWPVKALTRLINQPWQERLKRHPYVLHEPIWPGFAINTVFYAFVLWLLFAAPFALRRRRRIKRGLCPKCAYDLRNRPSESSVCPECGATLLNAA